MNCISPGPSVPGILQARILECVSCSRGSSWPRNQTCVSCFGRWILYHWTIWEAPWYWLAKIKTDIRELNLKIHTHSCCSCPEDHIRWVSVSGLRTNRWNSLTKVKTGVTFSEVSDVSPQCHGRELLGEWKPGPRSLPSVQCPPMLLSDTPGGSQRLGEATSVIHMDQAHRDKGTRGRHGCQHERGAPRYECCRK